MVADTYAGVFTTTHTPIVSTANKMPTGFYELTPTEAYIARSDDVISPLATKKPPATSVSKYIKPRKKDMQEVHAQAQHFKRMNTSAAPTMIGTVTVFHDNSHPY